MLARWEGSRWRADGEIALHKTEVLRQDTSRRFGTIQKIGFSYAQGEVNMRN